MKKYIQEEESSELNKAFIDQECKNSISGFIPQLQRSISTISHKLSIDYQESFSFDRQSQLYQWSINKSDNTEPKRKKQLILEDNNDFDNDQLQRKYAMTKKLLIGTDNIVNIIPQKAKPYYLRSCQKNIGIVFSKGGKNRNAQFNQKLQLQAKKPGTFLFNK